MSTIATNLAALQRSLNEVQARLDEVASTLGVELEDSPANPPQKRKRRTKAEMEAARAAEGGNGNA